MIKLFVLLLLLAGIGIAGAWLAEHPGSVTMYWFDYRIDTSFAFVLLLMAIAAFAIAYIAIIVRHVLLVPYHVTQARRLKYYRHGLSELTYGIAALAASDLHNAEAHTKKAEKLLGRTPIILLLSAQIARSRGDDGKTRGLLEQLLEHEETEYLAARSLSDAASTQQMFGKALELAQHAHSVNPREISSALSVISLHVRLNQWQEALAAIHKAARKGQLKRSDKRRYSGLVHVQHGMQLLEAGQVEAALAVARAGVSELPGFVPAVILAAKAFAANGQRNKAVKIILRAWKYSPQPPLADALRIIIASEPNEKQTKLMNKLAAIHPEMPSVSAWTCDACAHAQESWQIHCPACGAFATMEWKG